MLNLGRSSMFVGHCSERHVALEAIYDNINPRYPQISPDLENQRKPVDDLGGLTKNKCLAESTTDSLSHLRQFAGGAEADR